MSKGSVSVVTSTSDILGDIDINMKKKAIDTQTRLFLIYPSLSIIAVIMLGKITPLENILETYQPTEPVRRIHEQKDIELFSKSIAFDRLMTFIALLNESAYKKKISDPCTISPVRKRKNNIKETSNSFRSKHNASWKCLT